MSGPAIGLWLFEPRGFADILADVVPWLEICCEPVEAKASGDVDFWVRNVSALGLRAFDPADVGVFFRTVSVDPVGIRPYAPIRTDGRDALAAGDGDTA
ncbi:DUF6368 family protein [Streptomyces vinaceus]|uniref:DUF6368 family protein n=1 Tax=Streptomyces vinaceus TaxID=1960 RepID=UPI00381FAF97